MARSRKQNPRSQPEAFTGRVFLATDCTSYRYSYFPVPREISNFRLVQVISHQDAALFTYYKLEEYVDVPLNTLLYSILSIILLVGKCTLLRNPASFQLNFPMQRLNMLSGHKLINNVSKIDHFCFLLVYLFFLFFGHFL